MTPVRTDFVLDSRLMRDSWPLTRLALSELRILDDRRWPWIVVVPRCPAVEEMHELAPADQVRLTEETAMVARALKSASGCSKINIGALGNIVRQLHVHVIARNPEDPGWPGPVWGYGTREPYQAGERDRLAAQLRSALARERQATQN